MRLVAAGGTFAAGALIGLFGGIWLARTTGAGLWVLGGIFIGLAIGAAGAFTLVRAELTGEAPERQ